MEKDEMNETLQRNLQIRDRFLARAREYLLARDASQAGDTPHNRRGDDGQGSDAALCCRATHR
jgi:hypothetical protein